MKRPAPITLTSPLNAILTLGAVSLFLITVGILAFDAQFHPNGHLRYIIDSDVYRLGTERFWQRGDVFGEPMPSRYVELPFIYPPFAPLIMGPVALLSEAGAGLAFNLLTMGYVVLISYAMYTAYRNPYQAGVDEFSRGEGNDYLAYHNTNDKPGYLVRLKRAQEEARGRWADRFGHRIPMSMVGVVALFGAIILCSYPMLSTLRFGQINLALAGLVVLDVLWDEDRRPRWLPAGFLTGVAVAIKLTPAIFILFWFGFKGLRSCFALIAGFIVATLAAAAWSPSLTIQFFTDAMWSIDEKVGAAFGRNASLNGVFLRLEWPHWLALALSALIVAVAYIACRRMLAVGRVGLAMTMIALAGLAVSPISWSHHWVWLSLLPLFLWMEGSLWLGIVSFVGLIGLHIVNADMALEELSHDSGWLLHLNSASYLLFSVAVLILFAVFPRFGLRRQYS